jgi:hypothetical protein
MVQIIVAKEKLDCEHLLGTFVDDSFYDVLIESDTDVYTVPVCDLQTKIDCVSECNACDKGLDEFKVAFKFRKNFFTKEEQDMALEGLKDAASISNNRGIAAGNYLERDKSNNKDAKRNYVSDYQRAIFDHFMNPLDSLYDDDTLSELRKRKDDLTVTKGVVWVLYGEEMFDFEGWVDALSKMTREEAQAEAIRIHKKHVSGTSMAVPAMSGIAGNGWTRYPRQPYGRATAYTEHNYEKFKKCYPFIQSLNRGFKELMPRRWQLQKDAADKIDPEFLIPETVFTTLTVNNTWTTACHRDFSNLRDSISNLLVLSDNDNYSGGYLTFPEYRIAVNVRPGDLLIVENAKIIHGNTKITKNDPDAHRISVVSYFRDGMLDLGTKEYEDYRRSFVERNRLNKNHPKWHEYFNGVVAGMWESKEWYDFLLEHEKGRQWMDDYHQDLKDLFEASTLEDLMG